MSLSSFVLIDHVNWCPSTARIRSFSCILLISVQTNSQTMHYFFEPRMLYLIARRKWTDAIGARIRKLDYAIQNRWQFSNSSNLVQADRPLPPYRTVSFMCACRGSNNSKNFPAIRYCESTPKYFRTMDNRIWSWKQMIDWCPLRY